MDRQKVISQSTRGLTIVLGATGVQYVIALTVQITLARLLEPENFGAFAFASMVVLFFATLTDLHGGNFLIKEKEDIQSKLNNIFTLELILSTFFILLLLIVAPYLMTLLDKPELTSFVQLLVFALFYGPLSRPKSLFEKELSFWKARFPSICAQIISGGSAVTLAYLDYGVWSLVASHLIFSFSEVLIIWSISPFRPQFAWDIALIKPIVNYGLSLLGSSVLIFFYWNVDYYLVGHLLGKEQLGYYWFAFQTSNYFLKLKSSIVSVVYPAFSKIGNLEEIQKSFTFLTKATAVIYMFPTIIILVMGEDIIEFIFGAKWLPAVTPFKILMLFTALKAITAYWDPIILYKGKTKIQFYMTLYNSISVTLLVYIFTLYLGIVGTASGLLLAHLIGTFIMAQMVKKQVMQVNFWHLIKLAFHCSLLMFFLFFSKQGLYLSNELLFLATLTGCFLIAFYHFPEYFKLKTIRTIFS